LGQRLGGQPGRPEGPQLRRAWGAAARVEVIRGRQPPAVGGDREKIRQGGPGPGGGPGAAPPGPEGGGGGGPPPPGAGDEGPAAVEPGEVPQRLTRIEELTHGLLSSRLAARGRVGDP